MGYSNVGLYTAYIGRFSFMGVHESWWNSTTLGCYVNVQLMGGWYRRESGATCVFKVYSKCVSIQNPLYHYWVRVFTFAFGEQKETDTISFL